MKKTKKKLSFASSVFATGAMLGLTGCPVNAGVYGPPQSDPQPDVYGPPEFFEEEYNDPAQTDYGPPLIEEDIDEPQEEVYGPPESFDDKEITDPIETV